MNENEEMDTRTFKQRVADFWAWYPKVAQRFFETIEEGKCEALLPDVSKFMDKTFPGFGWVFGPGVDGGHSFTITGEGQVAKQLLTEYLCEHAVEIPKWVFFGSRQPSTAEALESAAVALSDDDSIDCESILLRTNVEEEHQVIDIVAWHPAFERLPEEHHAQILFLLLDEALGEFGTQMWLGEIEIEPVTVEQADRRLSDLPKFIDQVNKYHQWDKLPPLQSYTFYEANEQHDGPRGDTVVGMTCIPFLLFEMIECGGKLPEDPFEGLGASLEYLVIDGSVFPEGEQSEARGKIEDAIDERLVAEGSGRKLGGAYGSNNSYIDLLLLDGDNSREIVMQVIEELQLKNKARLETFV